MHDLPEAEEQALRKLEPSLAGRTCWIMNDPAGGCLTQTLHQRTAQDTGIAPPRLTHGVGVHVATWNCSCSSMACQSGRSGCKEQNPPTELMCERPQALLPLALDAARSRAAASEFLFLAAAGHHGLLPLLHEPREWPIKVGGRANKEMRHAKRRAWDCSRPTFNFRMQRASESSGAVASRWVRCGGARKPQHA